MGDKSRMHEVEITRNLDILNDDKTFLTISKEQKHSGVGNFITNMIFEK